MKYGTGGPSAVLYERVSYRSGDRLSPTALIKHSQTTSEPLVEDYAAEPSTRDSTTDLQLVILPPIVSGFSLSKRKWGFFSLDNIHAIDWNEDAYGDLQIDQKKKKTIRKLVKEHRENPDSFDNVIAGKGARLVLLLHGPPGSGKTMTAGMTVFASRIATPLSLTIT